MFLIVELSGMWPTYITISLAVIVVLTLFIISLTKQINEQKRLRKEAEIEQERYRVATELANDIIFEYNIKTDIMQNAAKFKTIFGRNPIIYSYTELMDNLKYVHKEDRSVYKEYCNALHIGRSRIEYEFRVLNAEGEYEWCHIRAKTICGSDNLPARVIGKVVNIDNQKRELEKLQFKAQRDPLTNMYNKGVTEEMIEDVLQQTRSYERHALLAIDIDNFKHVNDTYGHLKGDHVLTTISARLNSMFRAEDIIGRIGGDEFVALMKNVSSREQVENKAAALSETLANQFRKEEEDINVSGSIGIAIYPMDGKNYKELLQNADLALYEVKDKGKNNYVFFDDIKEKK